MMKYEPVSPGEEFKFRKLEKMGSLENNNDDDDFDEEEEDEEDPKEDL